MAPLDGNMQRLNAKSERESIIETLQDPKHLPTRREVQRGLRSFTTDDYGRSYVSGEDFDKIFAKGDAQEIITEEFIDSLGEHIRQFERPDRPAVVLEIGAGSGRLAHFLSEALNKKAAGKFEVIATNKADQRWDIKPVFGNVEQLDYKEALQKYAPDIVIVSWMPPNQDWSADIRKSPSVKEYILIGDPDATGHMLETWVEQRDGFTIEKLEEVSGLQIGRTSEFGNNRPETNVFRREKTD